jgi:RNA polymerase sigma factor (sigma-70 family)
MKDYCLKAEKELLERLQQNDEEALALLMKLYYDDLYNYAARFTKDDGLIKDCIQEVFISLWQRRETVGTILSPKYYFLRAIKNKVLKSLHKHVRKISPDHLQEDYDFFHEFSIERVIIEKQILKKAHGKKTLSLLSEKTNEIIYLNNSTLPWPNR